MRNLVVLLVFLLAACGQKGELYLRENPPPGLKPKAEPYKPVPYPERDGEAGSAK